MKDNGDHPQFNFDDDDDRWPKPPLPDDNTTLGKAKIWLEANVDEGVHCPLCQQMAKRYRRKLDKTMIRALGLLYKAGGLSDYVHGQEVLKHHARPAKEIGKLAYFNLVFEEIKRREDGGRSGWWLVTDTGYRFLKGQHQVHKYAIVYDGVVLRYEGELIGVSQVAPEFRFDDLMDGK